MVDARFTSSSASSGVTADELRKLVIQPRLNLTVFPRRSHISVTFTVHYVVQVNSRSAVCVCSDDNFQSPFNELPFT